MSFFILDGKTNVLTGCVLIFLAPLLHAQEYNWERPEGCTLVAGAVKDGDSFHVKHDGKDSIFRLYFVDTPEDDDGFPDRVADQAAYFGISSEKSLKLGHTAADFSTKILSEKPFTVYTLWQDALGAGSQQRFYAYVVTDKGPLCELLVSNGLARIYGKRITLPDGTDSRTYLAKLEALKEKATALKVGGWGSATTVEHKEGRPASSGLDKIPAF